MAVVAWRRILEGSDVSGKLGESLRIVEKWEVRTDSPLTSKLAILGAVPVGWNSAHWEFPDCKAQEFALSPNNRTGMVWTLSATFYIPPKDKKLNEQGRPEDFWECSGGTTTVPAFQDRDGNTITNSANDPLEGLEREREELSWTLTKYYDDDSWKGDRDTYAGSVNSSGWAGGDPRTWKCYFKSARKKELQNVDLNAQTDSSAEGDPAGGGEVEKKQFVETVWEFRREPETWKCMPWDVGFMELVSGQRAVIKDDKGNAVKQPVALNSDGTKRTPGQKPSVINNGQGVHLYEEHDFNPVFGTPAIIPVT